MRLLALGLVLSLSATACSSGPAEGDVVSAIVDAAVLPSLDTAAAAGNGLTAAVGEFCAAPSDDRLDAARAAWLDTRLAWNHAELVSPFGPAEMLRTVSKVDYFPVSPEGIDHFLETTASVNASYVSEQSPSTQRGLGALEHLLYGPPSLTPEGITCEMSNAVAEVAQTEITALSGAWAVSNGGDFPYSETLTAEMSSDDALADIVGSIVGTLKRQSLLEIGKALGESAPEPDPSALDEGAAGKGADAYLAQLEGIEQWLGAGGENSLIELIASRSQPVADDIEAHLESATSRLSEIDRPLRELAAEDSSDLHAIYDDLNALRVLFEADVVSLLDITLGFSDTDGDSG